MGFLESLDPVTLVNLILSLTIVAVAVWGYFKLKNITPLYIGAAYVLFSTSHAILLFKITWVPQALLIAIRLSGYFLVIFGLYAILKLVMELRVAKSVSESSRADSPLVQNLPRIAEYCALASSVIVLICLGIQGLVTASIINIPAFSDLSKGNPFLPGPFVLGLFLVLGICLFSLMHWKDERRISAMATVLAGIVFIFSLLFLISAVMGNIEGGQVVLHGDIIGIRDLIVPSILTVIGLALTAIVLLARQRTEPVIRDIMAGVSALVFAIGAFTLIGYAYQSPVLMGGATNPVTMASAVLFMILGTGLLADIGTGSRLLSQALDNSVQSQMMRGLIPVMVIAVLIEGWVCIVVLPSVTSIINPAILSAGIAVFSIVAISFVIAIQASQISAVITRAELERQKAEEQKQKSQALFKTMFESSGDAIWTMSNDIIVDCNRTAEVMLGTTRDKINGKSVLAFSPERQPDGQLSAQKAEGMVAAALEGNPQFFEWVHTRVDGTPFPTEITLNRVKCAKKFYLQASIRDITQRKKAEEELNAAYEQLAENEEELRQQFSLLAEKEAHLQQEEDKFHTMADFTVDWEFWLAPDNSFVYISPSCEEITGYSPTEFMQDPELMGRIVLKDDQPVSSHHKQTVHGTTQQGHVDFRIVRKDGEIRWISHSCRPVYGKDGTYLGRRATNSDVTARKMAEDALRESEGRVRRKLAAILEEEGDIGLLNLSDIIDVPALQALMDDIHRLTGIASAVIETDGTVLIGAGWQDICTQFHRVNPESCRNCIESDTFLTTGVRQGEFKLYKCKNNLWDIATPLIVGKKHLGNIFVGQFMLADEIPDIEVFRKQAEQYGFDEVGYLAAFNRVPRLSKETVSAVMAFYTRFAGLITNLSMSNITLARTGTERERLMKSIQEQYTILAETEEMFRNPVEHSPVGVYLQQDGIIRYANPRFAEMLGYTRDEILNKPFKELVDPDNLAYVCNPVTTQAKEDTDSPSRCIEFTSRKKDGTPIDLEIFEAPMEYQGRPAFYGTLVDITVRKKAEAAAKESELKLGFQNLELEASNEEVRSIAKTLQNNLDELLLSQKALRESEDKLRLQNMDLEASNEEIRAISETLQNNYDELAKSQKALVENEEKYRSLVDNISVAVYRNNVESPSRWLWVNPAFCKILGYESPEDALIHPVSDIYFADEDRLPLLRALNTVGFVKNYEIILKKKNGAPIWVSLSAQVKRILTGPLHGSMVLVKILLNVRERRWPSARAKRKCAPSLNLPERRYMVSTKMATARSIIPPVPI
jgi:PAS domain S-box-containing protein